MDIAFLIYDFGIASYTYAYFGYLGFHMTIMSVTFKDKVVVITGAGGGLGRT